MKTKNSIVYVAAVINGAEEQPGSNKPVMLDCTLAVGKDGKLLTDTNEQALLAKLEFIAGFTPEFNNFIPFRVRLKQIR